MKQLLFIVAALALVAWTGTAQAGEGCSGENYTAGTQSPVQTVQVPAPEKPKSGS